MELRIGIARSPREVLIELPEDVDRADLKKQVDAALSGATDVLWLTDVKGGESAVPSSQIAYVELSAPSSAPSVGFG